MRILVDIGNSRVKWALMDRNSLAESQSFDRNKTGIKASLNKEWKTLSDIESVYIANVAGQKIADQVTEWIEKQWKITPKFIQAEKKHFGVTNAYDEPEKLGVDRWLSLISARQHARLAQCVIDCGTAITIDIVTKTGEHQGGMILPGINMMKNSLVNNTDALNHDVDNQEFTTLATNTFSAIQAGTLYTVTAALERIISDLRQSFDGRIRFIITGGDAETLIPLLANDVHYYPNIVLKGLAFYARLDNKRPPRTKHSKPKQEAEQSNEENSNVSDSTKIDNSTEAPKEVDYQQQSPLAAENDVIDSPKGNEAISETVSDATTSHADAEDTVKPKVKKPARKPRQTKAKSKTVDTEKTSSLTEESTTPAKNEEISEASEKQEKPVKKVVRKPRQTKAKKAVTTEEKQNDSDDMSLS
ncbi:hypothetical protein LCGC14_1208840 [marine sediment metagenome]|uniref:Type III pantothenate kinase n=1 Tax=marine sediment metagenome TaxID=412755 RepID=A0A0F9NX08_9ZZZZ|nr:type III pantothenate kinase [Methylophaga sp.]